MKIIKAVPFCHGGSGILSVDIQPGDERFATAGRAEGGAGLVVIWNFRLFAEEKPLKLLCRLENHGGCVNCVRWSESGRYLASAGDDSFVTIMQYVGRLASAPGDNLSAQTGDVQNVERWKCAHTLRGHGGDVLHVAWSPNDSYLASCSIDNQIIVWCGPGPRFGERVATLSGHQSLVKGLTWDPVGMYLASQSDDRSLRIWTVGSWKTKKVIQKPFDECGATTQFLRLDWSPDGNVIASGHAMNNGGPVSKLIDRGGWEADRDIVGHRKAITCARWSSCFYEMTRPGSNKPVQFCVLAVGSKDRNLSFWSTEQQRPLKVSQAVFTQSLMDLSWSRGGRHLTACSSDGSIACFSFAENDIGRVMSAAEKIGIMQQSYGKHGISSMANGYTNGHDADRHFVIDNPEMAKLHHVSQKSEATVATTSKKPAINGLENTSRASTSTAEQNLNGPQTQQPQQLPQQKQIEVRTKDGKRRIQPIFLGSAVIAEPVDDVTAPRTESETANDPLVNNSITVAAASTSAPDRSSVTTEILPAQLSDNNQMETQVPSTSGTAVATASPVESSAPLKSLQIKRKQGEAPVTQSAKKSRQQQQRRNRRAILSDDEDDEVATRLETEDNQQMEPEGVEKQTGSTTIDCRAITLSVPAKCNQLIVYAEMATNRGNDKIKITCQNGVRVTAAGSAVSTLQATKYDAPLWHAMVASEVLALSANLFIVAAAGTDRRLTVFKASNGQRLMSSLVLDSDISVLQNKQYYVMTVTSAGTVQVWCFEGTYSCLCKESIQPIMTNPHTSVSSGFITDYGMPVLTLSNGKSYEYNSTMKTWISVFDPQDAMTASSIVRTRSTMMDSLQMRGPFADCLREGTKLASATKSQISSSSANAHGHQNALVIAGFLESQMNSAFELRSAQEFQFWLMQYVDHLAKGGLVNELKHLCEDLMDSESGNAATNSKKISLLGFSDWKALVNAILLVIATNPKLQRLYGEMKQQMAAREPKDTENRPHGNDSML